MNEQSRTQIAQYYILTSNPQLEDSDDDGLSDLTENSSWKIQTINRTIDGEAVAYRWNGSVAEDGHGVLWVSSDPLEVDSDDDGLTDFAEKEHTHTDPEDPVTYGISRDQAELIRSVERNNYQAVPSLQFRAETFGVPHDLAREDVQAAPGGLTDRTSDFDFVTDDAVVDTQQEDLRAFDRLTFTALDGTTRTDTWLSNEDEIWLSHAGDLFGAEGEIDPWDPDSDDDGLTDGQEVHGFTQAWTFGFSPSTANYVVRKSERVDGHLNPLDPDTDGDGYWDGWIGVPGVGNSDNVLLSRERLRDDDGNGAPSGIRGGKPVDEQVEIHGVDGNGPGAR